MNIFKFADNPNELNTRSNFVNNICRLLVLKHNGNLELAVAEGQESLFDQFHEHIRNVYELEFTEIPLIAYYRLISNDFDECMLEDSEITYEDAMASTIEACKRYYSD